MDNAMFGEVLDELFSSLESLETQARALTQLLKDKGIVSEEEFTRYLHPASEASGVRWRAERVRINSLLASAFKSMEESLAAKIEKGIEDREEEARKQGSEKEAPSSARDEKKPEPQHSSVSNTNNENDKDVQLPSRDQTKNARPAKDTEAA